MMYFNTIAKTFSTRLALLVAVLLGNAGAAFAAHTLTIQDFGIKAGETKEVAVELTSTADDIFSVTGTINLPAGLEFVSYSAGVNCRPAARTGAIANLRPSTGLFTVKNSSQEPFEGTSGDIITIKVKASANFNGGRITYTDVVAKRISADPERDVPTVITEENVTGTPTNVTLEQGGVDPNPDDPTPVPGVNAIAFGQSTVEIQAGRTATIDIALNNGDEFTGIEGYLSTSNGITITDVKKTSRLAGRLTWNENRGYFGSLGAISGNSGAILTVTVQASPNFNGTATLSVSEVVATTASAQGVDLADTQVTIVAAGAVVPELALTFADSEISLLPGASVDVPVYVATNISLSGFMAKLTLPAGITAQVKKGDLTTTAPSYNTTSGNITYLNTIADGEGSLFILTLTADETFTEDAELSLTDINATPQGASSVYAEDITLTIKAKDEAAKAEADAIADALQEKLDNAVAEIAENYPDAAEDEEIVGDEAGIQDEIDALKQQIEEAYADNTLDPEKIQEIADGISKEIDDLLEKAAEKQKAIDDEKAAKQANEDGKKALDDEIAELQQKLDAAEAAIPADVPADAKKALEDDAAAIQDQIDALKAQAEKDYADGKLTADSKLDPEKKKAVLDAIDALKANIASWLRGDVDKDGDVDMDDFYALKKLISDEKTPKADEDANFFYRCDANADGEINVGDLQGILNICTGLSANGK